MLDGELYDVALLILKNSISGVTPIEFPKHSPRFNQKLSIHGFGSDEYGLRGHRLKQGQMKVALGSFCDEWVRQAQNVYQYPKWWHPLFGKNVTGKIDVRASRRLPRQALFCAESREAAMCEGDSGGPLTDGTIQYGLVTNADCRPLQSLTGRWVAIAINLNHRVVKRWLQLFGNNAVCSLF